MRTASAAECAGRLWITGMPKAASRDFDAAGSSHSLPAARAASSSCCAAATSGEVAAASGAGTCSNCSWFAVNSASAAMASTAASGVGNVGMRLSAKRWRARVTASPPIQQVKTGLRWARATSISVERELVGVGQRIRRQDREQRVDLRVLQAQPRGFGVLPCGGVAPDVHRVAFPGTGRQQRAELRERRAFQRGQLQRAPAARSAASCPGPPAFVTMPSRRPRRRTPAPSVLAALNSCDRSRIRSTPARRIAASNTSSPPTSEPVWNAMLPRDSSARPAFITTTGLTRAAARNALMKRRASPTLSRYSMIPSVERVADEEVEHLGAADVGADAGRDHGREPDVA